MARVSPYGPAAGIRGSHPPGSAGHFAQSELKQIREPGRRGKPRLGSPGPRVDPARAASSLPSASPHILVLACRPCAIGERCAGRIHQCPTPGGRVRIVVHGSVPSSAESGAAGGRAPGSLPRLALSGSGKPETHQQNDDPHRCVIHISKVIGVRSCGATNS
jgi:hypothetical protein